MGNPEFSLFQGYTKADFLNGPQELFFVDLLVSYDWSEMVGVTSGELMCNTHIFIWQQLQMYKLSLRCCFEYGDEYDFN